MNCERLQHRLQDFLDGKLTADECAEAEIHLSSCTDCRELLSLARAGDEAGTAPDLVPAVLQRTTGSACERAHAILCDLEVEAPTGIDKELLRLHMDACAPCTALAAALARLAVELPAMAEAVPPVDLLAGVLAATTQRRRPWVEFVNRARATALALLDRPRIAWEAGYVGAMSLWLVISLLGTPLQAAASIPIVEPSALVIERVTNGVSAFGRRAWPETGGRGLETLLDLQSEFVERYRRTAPARDELRANGDRLKDAAARFDLDESGQALKALTDDARVVWQSFSMNPETRNDAPTPGD